MKDIPNHQNDKIQSGLTRSREAREEDRQAKQFGVEAISEIVVDAAFHLHRDLGPGLLESVYEAVLSRQLEKRGLRVMRQVPVRIEYDGLIMDEGFRADLVVEERLVIELKSVETLAAVHPKQLLTYLRLMRLPLGLLINFGAATFREGVRRVVNDHRDFAASRLRVHQLPTSRS